MSGFRKFVLRGNMIDLAVAVVIGTQFSNLVKQFVRSFITPLLGLVGGQPDFSSLVLTVGGARFTYGAFLTEALSFLIAAAVVYFVIVLPVTRLLKLFERDAEATERDCPECTRKIPVAARRCPECTAEIAPATGPSPPVPAPRRG
ncbi:MAG: large conductance mechanosensitive channel protein [Actinoallomurus sp.]|jgi:large conductance mechanosensitive channel|nr:large conductance mechanosensitive channel protein [Actinoallomurus sp.]